MVDLILAMMMAQTPGVGLVTVGQGSSSGIQEPRAVIVRSADEWQTLWKSHAGVQAPPAVDFSKDMVAAVFLGTRPTGGYSVAIAGARREKDVLIVEYVERVPAADALVTQVLTSPFHIVTFARFAGPVQIRRAAPGGV